MSKMHGGMVFRQGAIVRLPTPPKLLPAHTLRITCFGKPVVSVDDPVTRGQLIHAPPDIGRGCVISPIDGVVTAVTRWRDTSMLRQSFRYESAIDAQPPVLYDVTIKHTADEMVETHLDLEPPNVRTTESWHEALRTTGTWTEGGGRFNVIRQLAAALQKKPNTLICVGLDAFAPYPDSSSLLDSFPDDVVLGTQILGDIFGVKHLLLLASMNNTVLSRLKPSCRNFRVPLSAVSNVYPAADPTLVAWRFASGRRRLPHGANPIDKGVVLIGPWTAIRIARWFTNRQLDLLRPVMIGWPNASESITPCYTLPGMPMSTLHGALAGHAAVMVERVVWGNPLTGRPIQTAMFDNRDLLPTITDNEHLISVLSPQAPREPDACISCGWCAQVCPTLLRPIRLVEQIKAGKGLKRVNKQLNYCIECGLCSHVCPSHIPLAQILRRQAEATL